MKITTETRKLGRILNNQRSIKRYFGQSRAKRIEERLDEFSNAITLHDIPYNPPARCHQLRPHYQCRFAVDVSRNYRIVFEGYDKQGRLSSNKNQITIIQILTIEDYH